MLIETVMKAEQGVQAQFAGVTDRLDSIRTRMDKVGAPPKNFFLNERHETHVSKHQARVETRSTGVEEDGAFRLPKGEHKILRILAQHENGVTRNQLTILSGYRRSSRDAYVARLKAKGLVCESQNGDKICISGDGFDFLGPDVEPLPTGDALRSYHLNRLPRGEAAVLQVVCSAYPEPVNREFIDKETGYQRSSRDAYLARLAARKLIEMTGPGLVRAAKELFS